MMVLWLLLFILYTEKIVCVDTVFIDISQNIVTEMSRQSPIFPNKIVNDFS